VGLPLAVRVLLVLVHLRTNLTTRALAVLFATSQSGPIGSSATWFRCTTSPSRPVEKLSAQHQHPDHHLLNQSRCGGGRRLLARQPSRRHGRP
jgi:hypothetical protein